jgi:hypothetical protein
LDSFSFLTGIADSSFFLTMVSEADVGTKSSKTEKNLFPTLAFSVFTGTWSDLSGFRPLSLFAMAADAAEKEKRIVKTAFFMEPMFGLS